MKGGYLDFSVNLNPVPLSTELLKRINKEMNSLLSCYPNEEDALNFLADYYSIPVGNIVIGNGSTEIFFILPDALCFKGAIVVMPTFWEYTISLERSNSKVILFYVEEKDNFNLDIIALERFVGQKVKEEDIGAVYLCNPNNPTSTLVRGKEVIRLCNKFPKIKFVVDETYLLFDKDYRQLSLISTAISRQNLVVVFSFSKFFNIPGARIGVCVASNEDIKSIKSQRVPYGLNGVGLKMIPMILRDKKYAEFSRDLISSQRQRLYKRLSEIPYLKVFEPRANYILVKIVNAKKGDATDLCNFLDKEGIIARHGANLGLGGRYVRFTVRTIEENDFLIKVIKKSFEQFRS